MSDVFEGVYLFRGAEGAMNRDIELRSRLHGGGREREMGEHLLPEYGGSGYSHGAQNLPAIKIDGFWSDIRLCQIAKFAHDSVPRPVAGPNRPEHRSQAVF